MYDKPLSAEKIKQRLRMIMSPEKWDCWFDVLVFCHFSCPGQGCSGCPAEGHNSNGESKCLAIDSRAFCDAFRTCEECGLECGHLRDLLQKALDKCEEVGLWD